MRDGIFKTRWSHERHVLLVDACSGQGFGRHTHDEFGIGLVTAGAQRSWSGRGTVEAFAGNLITVNPGEVHDGAPIGESRSWRMIYMSQAMIAGLVENIGDGGPSLQAERRSGRRRRRS